MGWKDYKGQRLERTEQTVGQADNRTTAPINSQQLRLSVPNCTRTKSVNMNGKGVHELSPLAEEPH